MLDKAAVIIGIVFLVLAFGTFFLHGVLRKNRRLYRLGYALTALSGMATAILLVIGDEGSMDEGARTVAIVFFLIVGVPIFLYNFVYLIIGEGKVITSTLVNCRIQVIRSGKLRQRVSYKVEGTSLEGNKASFLLRYPDEKKAIDAGEITPQSRIVVRYYDRTHSIADVTR